MKSLFLRMFLWFCAANAIVVFAIVVGYGLSNPDQLPFSWPTVGRGAIVSAAHVAVGSYERGGAVALEAYLESLVKDTGLEGGLFDDSRRDLSGGEFALVVPEDWPSLSEGQITLRIRGRLAGLRIRGSAGQQYIFLAKVPPREPGGVWSRIFVLSFIFTGALLCYLLTRHITAPVVHLRALTSRFSRGDLTARIVEPGVLERKDEIGGLARDFNQMASRIETLLKSQQRLVADVSHELRSPITRLSLALGLMRRHREGDPRTSLTRMEREIERLNALIAQLLTLSRLEAQDQPPPMERIDLGALVQEIAADADFEATSMNRSVRLAELAACSMPGARDLLRSAVENVVRNALKYTVPNSVVIIRLLCVKGHRAATIAVEDQGPGVPTEALQHIFEPFYRVDEARDRRSGGTGLGLAITQRIVTLHGGTVHAANREGGGLEMRIVLPADAAL